MVTQARTLAAAALVGVLVGVSWVSGASSAAGPTAVKAAGRGERLSWTACHGDAECATLPVPLDDSVAESPTIDLALVRYRARQASERIGSLLVNPGGPGASGVDFVVNAIGAFPDEILDRFDIVGFDPRGVGRSSAVDCTDDLDAYYALDFSPETDAEQTALEAGAQEFVDACSRQEGGILPYLSTQRSARDLDRIRDALGDDQLTYLGYSYGTYLGAWYAEQFPQRVRALVLDGAVDPALDATAVQVDQAQGFERSLERFLKWCSRESACAFNRDGASARAFDRLRTGIDRRPVRADGAGKGRTLNSTQFDIAVVQSLYLGRDAWEQLAQSLDGAARGNGSDLLYDFDAYVGLESGTYDDAQEAFLATSCADGPPVGDVTAFRAIEAQVAAVAPRLGPWIVNNSLPCAFWPVAAPAATPLHATGAAPIVVVGTANDPATPLKWARGLADEFDAGVLVTVAGSRHTSFGSGNVCVDALVIHYVVDLEVPEAGIRC